MEILISDLDEHAARFGQQFPRHGQPVAEVGEVAVNP